MKRDRHIMFRRGLERILKILSGKEEMHSSDTNYYLTEDGKLVSLNNEHKPNSWRKKATDEQIKNWIKKKAT